LCAAQSGFPPQGKKAECATLHMAFAAPSRQTRTSLSDGLGVASGDRLTAASDTEERRVGWAIALPNPFLVAQRPTTHEPDEDLLFAIAINESLRPTSLETAEPIFQQNQEKAAAPIKANRRPEASFSWAQYSTNYPINSVANSLAPS